MIQKCSESPVLSDNLPLRKSLTRATDCKRGWRGSLQPTSLFILLGRLPCQGSRQSIPLLLLVDISPKSHLLLHSTTDRLSPSYRLSPTDHQVRNPRLTNFQRKSRKTFTRSFHQPHQHPQIRIRPRPSGDHLPVLNTDTPRHRRDSPTNIPGCLMHLLRNRSKRPRHPRKVCRTSPTTTQP